MAAAISYSSRAIRAPNSPDFRAYITHNGCDVSALNDIPLFPPARPTAASELHVHMIVHAGRWTNAHMTLDTHTAFTPIRPVLRGRKVAYVRNVFPHRGYIWNCGILSQTWSDGGPIHILEVGDRVADLGEVRVVRVLGLLASRDEGQLRWALLAVDTADDLAQRLYSLADLERVCPGMITATKEWLRLYKLPDGKDENTLEFNGEVKPVDFAREVISRCHDEWKNLVYSSGAAAHFDQTNVTLRDSPGYLALAKSQEEQSRIDEMSIWPARSGMYSFLCLPFIIAR
ncbi:unnamed protein product [Mycena citricolor]|uniref:inorganic diphosphatase n=1 Tax=Mycena citricolor TaxID=2018698 RepID=A0AAD2HV16_9AGAR|nr:unnamed protein product [Mycena citricolor]